MYLNQKLKNICIFSFIVINFILIFFSTNKFPGNLTYFFGLFFISNLYLFYSFKYSQLFIDKTLSIFLWLGFFYKLTILLITNSGLPEGKGNFSYLPHQYDELLIYSIIGILSFFLSSIIIQRYLINFFKLKFIIDHDHQSKLLEFYHNYKKYLFFSFLILILFVTILNFKLGFYQKGLLPKNDINLYLGYFVKWMLLFGLTSISCILIEYDIKKYNNISLIVIFLFFFELIMTNFSLLSRALIFTGSAILFSTYVNYENSIQKKKLNNSLFMNSIILFLVFSLSIFPINKIRNYNFIDQAFVAEKIIEKSIKNETKNSDLINNKNDESVSIDKKSQENIKDIVNSNIEKDAKIKLVQKKLEEKGIQNLDFKKNVNRILFVIKNRFVGLDGVATVTSYPEKNFRLFFNSLKEEFNPNEYGFYQKNFIIPFEQKHLVGKEYEKTSRRHYGIILPGIISFLSTPGSKIFLFFSGFFIFMLCAILELLAKKMTYGSIIFSNLVGYVLGYRLIHFGYIPKQSYLLLGAIILTIIIIKLIKSIIIKSYNVRQSY